MNAILTMGERDRMPGKRRGGGGGRSGLGGGDWDDDEEWDDEDMDEYGDDEEEEDWEDEEQEDDDSSEDDYMLVAESEKRRKGEGDEGEERRRGVRRRRKRQGNDRRAREKSERRHAKQQDERKEDDSSSARQSRNNRAKTSRDVSPTRSSPQHQQVTLSMDASVLQSSVMQALPPAAAPSDPSTASAHTHSDPSFCKSCHACIHCLDKPPPYPSTLPSVLPFPLPGNGYVSILRLYSAETMFHRLELSTSKRSSKEDQALLALIRKLLSYFQHTTDARIQNPFIRFDQDTTAIPLTVSTANVPPPTDDAAAINTVDPPPPPAEVIQPQWSPPVEMLKEIPPSEWVITAPTPDSAADITTSTASTASDTASTSSDLSTTSTASAFISTIPMSLCRPHCSALIRSLRRSRQRQLQRLNQQQFQQKRRELRFLLTGIRGELPAAFNKQPQQTQPVKAKEKEKTKAKDVAKEQSANAAAKAAKAEASKKASIEELIRAMQEKERVLTAMQESKKAELRELKEREKEMKDRKAQEKVLKAVKEESREAEAAVGSMAVQLDEDEAGGEDEDGEDEDEDSPVAADDKARRKKEKRGKKKEKQKAGKKKAAEKAKTAKVKVDYKAAVGDGSAEVDDVIERMREERRREQEEMEKKRVEAGLQTAAQERIREAEEEQQRVARKEEQQRLDQQRRKDEEQRRAADEVKRKEDEIRKREERRKAEEEKEKRRLQQIELDKENERKQREREKQREAEEKARREEEAARVKLEEAKQKQRAAEAAAIALAHSQRQIHTCRYNDCPSEHRILASEYYVVLTCSTQCRIRYHHRSPASSAPSASVSPSCWELGVDIASIKAGCSCPTADCAGQLHAASLYHDEAELVEQIIAPPAAIERPSQQPAETKTQKRERKRAERQKAEQQLGGIEERKEAVTVAEAALEADKGKAVYKGGLEVLVPAKEKDFVPVIPRPSLFAAVSDEMKEKSLRPISPQPAVTPIASANGGAVTAVSHTGSERKKGRQARKTRIDIFLPEAEPEEEEPPQPAEEEAAQSQAGHYPIEMTNTAYGGFVRCYTNASTSPLLYCRCLSSSTDDDSVIQWMVSQCALIGPIYVTRFFAPSAVLVQYLNVQTAVKAYQALGGSMYLQFAIEPCSIVSGDDVRAVQAYQERMMNKLRGGHVMQQSHPFDSSSYLYDTAQAALEQPVVSHETTALVAPPAAPANSSVYTGFFERDNVEAANARNGLVSGGAEGGAEDELDTDQLDFSFLAIGADEYDEARAAQSTTSPPTSDSPPTPLNIEKQPANVNGSFPSFGSSWSSPQAEFTASSSWASPSHGPTPAASFASMPAVASVFSPMSASNSNSATVSTSLFTPTSPPQKPSSVASLAPALDPILSSPPFSFTASTSPPETVSSNSQRRSVSNVAPLFSSGSLFASAAGSQPSTELPSASSAFDLPSFSMFSSLTRSMSITDDTSTDNASTATSAPSFFSASTSTPMAVPHLLQPSATSTVRQSLSSSVSDDDDDEEVWNDEKMSRFVLKSDAEDEEESGLNAISTHPRHDSIGDSNDDRVHDGREDEHDVSDVRTNSDSIDAYEHDQDIDRDFSQRSELPVEEEEPLQYDSRQPQPRYSGINTSPSPRFARANYPAAATSAVPSHQNSPLHAPPVHATHPSMLHPDAASMAAMYGGGMAHGWNGNVSPSPGYAPYGYNGYPNVAMTPMAQYYWAQYGNTAQQFHQQHQQLQQYQHMMAARYGSRQPGRGMPAPKMPHNMPGLPGTSPMSAAYTQLPGGLGTAYAHPQHQQRPGDSEEVSPTDGSSQRDDRRRGKRGFVVDLEADFPSLGAAPPAAAQPSAASSTLSPSSSSSSLSSAVHSTAAYTQSYSTPQTHPDTSHADANGHNNGEGGVGWTGTLANKLKGSKEDRRPGTAGSSNAAVNAPPGSPPTRQMHAASTASSVSSPASSSPPQPSISSRPQSGSKPLQPPAVVQSQSAAHSVHVSAAPAAAARSTQQQHPAAVQQQRSDVAAAKKDSRVAADSKPASASKQNKSGAVSTTAEWTEVVSAGKKKKR